MLNRARMLVTSASLYALVGGIVSLTGWVADIPPLADWDHDGIATQPNAALAAIGAGLGLLAFVNGRTRAATVLGAVVALIGATALFQWLTGIDLEFVNTALTFDRVWGRVAGFRWAGWVRRARSAGRCSASRSQWRPDRRARHDASCRRSDWRRSRSRCCRSSAMYTRRIRCIPSRSRR